MSGSTPDSDAALVRPCGQVGRHERPHPLLVAGLVASRDPAGPFAVRPGPQERGSVPPDAQLGRRDDVLGPLAHALDRRLGRELHGPRGRERDLEGVRQPAQLRREVGPVVGVVEERDVRVPPVLPRLREVVEDEGQTRRATEVVLLDEVLQPLLGIGGGDPGRDVAVVGRIDRLGPELPHPVHVEVLVVMLHGDRDVPRVTTDDDVGGPGIERQPVERGVGLDEPPVVLRVVHRHDVVDRARLHVEPRRELAERSRELRAVEDEQGAEHLGPRRAALGWRADHDVARPEPEAQPAVAVGDERAVAHAGDSRVVRWEMRPSPG